MLHMAIMDASIGCYDATYFYWYLRPDQADSKLTTPVGKPNGPSYPSAHSCLSSAAAGVLAARYPSDADALGVTVQEAAVSRICAGLHYDFDVTAAQTLGYAVAALALEKASRGGRQSQWSEAGVVRQARGASRYSSVVWPTR